ncbi:hypothetical protein [Aquimarina litoralis]|uniref:hypothetical protein n=1 Tax=Aquimarina litoralis TaxID=584605 RepID=UPI001C5940BC|nr:hypothetical protein [Aquimarina litoralis]MBW1297503.1 hypothetical protein [Aquimarina litoralis]
MTTKHYCENNESRLNCKYQITFSKNQYIIYENSKKIDAGNFEIEHQYDQVYFINFDSSLQDEISGILGTSTIRLHDQKEEGFVLFAEQTSDLYVLKK